LRPAPRFDAAIHAPGRLQICGILSAADEAEFAMIRDTLEVSDSVLSKHLKALEEAGHIKLRKAAADGRQRTWASLTAAGRTAFAGHVAELQRLAGIAGE
jgi:DNA-binding MarR family transcriptional regulator